MTKEYDIFLGKGGDNKKGGNGGAGGSGGHGIKNILLRKPETKPESKGNSKGKEESYRQKKASPGWEFQSFPSIPVTDFLV